jgi:hypothetical protein
MVTDHRNGLPVQRGKQGLNRSDMGRQDGFAVQNENPADRVMRQIGLKLADRDRLPCKATLNELVGQIVTDQAVADKQDIHEPGVQHGATGFRFGFHRESTLLRKSTILQVVFRTKRLRT